ncbi:hypothetical protein [Lewinella sp. JB7]|uniref:hypothetical protein n=1 Tax=Lewinella sp. JB7 TaxID=2962887 RepID=UPI0020C94ECD|nr:hypothetical protein [Lewinella sp. JB7]MCP9237716.1 hypothetical protein [Lewinella sp. JB7]
MKAKLFSKIMFSTYMIFFVAQVTAQGENSKPKSTEADVELEKTIQKYASIRCTPDELKLLSDGYIIPDSAFVISPFGYSWHQPNQILAGSSVYIDLILPKGLSNQVGVIRTSETRDVNVVHYFGVPDDQNAAMGSVPDEETCTVKRLTLSYFEAGEGKMAIQARNGLATLNLAEYAFPVSATYSGSIVFGPVLSLLKDRSFSIVPSEYGSNTNQNTSTLNIEEYNNIHYVAGFTAFLNGPRAIEPSVWDPHVDLFMGIDVVDPLDNGYLGFNISLNGFFSFNVGAHAGKVNRLASYSNLSAGDNITLGEGESIPTVSKWDVGLFVGFNIDARSAAIAFSKTVRGLIN